MPTAGRIDATSCVLLAQQTLCSFDPLFQAVLEILILAAAFYMSRYRSPDYFGYGAIFNSSNSFKCFRLLWC